MGFLDKVKKNLGSGLPPHISTKGNMFTLRDAVGNERPAVHTLDVILVDANAHISKQYRDDPNYKESDPTPPDCFSDNGSAPSNYALKPQSETCQTCKWNVRGSAVSKVTGKGIKACRDEQKLAVLVTSDEQPILYRLTVTPGSLQAFRDYVRSVESAKYEPDKVITRLSFVPKSTGMLKFEAIDAVDDDAAAFIATLQETPQSRFVTGEDDRSIGALPANPVPRPEETKPAGPTRKQLEAIFGALPTSEEAKPAGPTREQLEAQLEAMRAKGSKPKLKAVEPEVPSPVAPVAEVPAFLRKRDAAPSNGAFGMTTNAPPPPDAVGKLIDAHTEQAPAIAERMKTAFNLPLRS